MKILFVFAIMNMSFAQENYEDSELELKAEYHEEIQSLPEIDSEYTEEFPQEAALELTMDPPADAEEYLEQALSENDQGYESEVTAQTPEDLD